MHVLRFPFLVFPQQTHTGVGGGANKKDAKHAASESALNGLLQSGRVSGGVLAGCTGVWGSG